MQDPADDRACLIPIVWYAGAVEGSAEVHQADLLDDIVRGVWCWRAAQDICSVTPLAQSAQRPSAPCVDVLYIEALIDDEYSSASMAAEQRGEFRFHRHDGLI